MDFTTILPEDICEKIFLSLDNTSDLVSAAACNRTWRRLCFSDKIWLKICKLHRWTKFGYGALDLLYLPHSDKLSSRTNVSGTSPQFFSHRDEKFLTLPKWMRVYILSRYLVANWLRGRYNVFTLRGHATRVSAIDCTGNVLVSGSPDRILVWDLESASIKFNIQHHSGDARSISVLGYKFAVGYSDGTIRVYDFISGRSIMSFHARREVEIVKFVNENTLIASYGDKSLKIWNLKEKTLFKNLAAHTDDIECMEIDGMLCFTGGWDNKLIVWDIFNGDQLFTLSGHENAVTCLCVRGDMVYSGSSDETVKVWKLSSTDCLHTLDGHTSEVYCIACNGEYLAASGSSSLIAVWRTADYSLLYGLKRHLGVVRSLSFSHDLLVSGGDRKMICVWDLQAGTLQNIVHRNPDLLHLMFVNETKIITASPNNPGSMTFINYW